MHEMSVTTDRQRSLRMREIIAEKAAEERDHKVQQDQDKRANSDFTQVYPKGWKRLQVLMRENAAAARIYAFLAEHIDAVCGAVVVSQEVMAEALDVHRRTIVRHTAYLEKVGAVVRIQVGIGVYAYCLDPSEVWRSWHKSKDLAAFVTKTLVSKTERQNSLVDRRLRMMVKEINPSAEEPAVTAGTDQS